MKGSKILVVEDENIVALDIRRHLERNGYIVPSTLASGEETIAKIETLKPDVVLMDIKLQGKMDGLEAADIVKGKYNIPVILLTAFADETTIERAKRIEPFGYIIKPFEERELRTAIEMALYRHSMENKLKERERLFYTTLNSIADAVVVTDTNQRIQFINPVAESLGHISGADASGKLFREVFPIKDLEKLTDSRSYTELTPKNGVTIPIELTASFLEDEAHNRFGIVWVLNDISKRKKLEEQLYQAQKLEGIGRLAGGIAHDFNNILTVITGYSNLILENLSRDDSLRKDVEGIQNAAMKAATLTRQLLAFSRTQVLNPRVIDLNNLIVDMKKMLRRLITEEIEIRTYLEAPQPFVHVDPSQIERVIINLTVNSRDAMPDGGVLTIETKLRTLSESLMTQLGEIPSGSYVVLSIKDTGIGIDENILTKIFDPFFTTKEKGKGTGLGLSTVYGIVQQSNGYIEVESRQRVETCFSIYLPQVKREEKSESHQEDKHPAELAGTETILVVEDEEIVRTLISKILKKQGYQLIEVQNAGEALLVCEEFKNTIHLLISDIVMPHMNGIVLAERLKKEKPNMKVLLISGYSDEIISSRGKIRPDFSLLQKPFEPEALSKKVREILDQ